MKSHLSKEIHKRALEIASQYRRAEIDLIEILEKVDRHKVYRRYDCSSLFKYATDVLKLSESVAYIFINVARKSRQVPQLKEEIRRGNISVSKAKKIVLLSEFSSAFSIFRSAKINLKIKIKNNKEKNIQESALKLLIIFRFI